MIPLYPPRQGDPHLRKLVKWRSLVQLVSHSRIEEEDTPRVRSHSTVVFFPTSRKHSSLSQNALAVRKKSDSAIGGLARSSSVERRRPSAPVLTDLRRFLPTLKHRSRSTASIQDGDEDGVGLLAEARGDEKGVEPVLPKHQVASASTHPTTSHQRPDSAFFGAKNRVQRLKAAATSVAQTKETVATESQPPRSFFKKQGRKPFTVGQSAPIASSSVHVAAEPLIITSETGNAHQSLHGADQQQPNKQSIIVVDAGAQDSTTQLLVSNSPNTCISVHESDEGQEVVVVVDPSSIPSNKGSSSLLKRKAQVGGVPISSPVEAPGRFSHTEQSSLVADSVQSNAQKAVEHSTSDQCFSSEAFQSTLPTSAGNQNSSGKLTKSSDPFISHPCHSTSFSHLQSFTTAALNKPYPSLKRRSNSYPLSRRESLAFYCKRAESVHTNQAVHPLPSVFFTNNHNCSFAQQAFATTAELFGRRHSLPDMAIAAYGMVICGTDELQHKYRGRIEKVKFGVPISEAFSHDIPATLLVLLLKVNKEGPLKKDIWRAPGNQAQVRKLSHIMQHGRLVNISHISVYTAASVIKKFLSKLPGGIFGLENEQTLFNNMQNTNSEQQRQVFCRVICSLSLPSQHLLVLLFGTFRIIADSAETFNTRMNPDAIGISVAPSLLHSCMQDEQRAKLEDVMRFKLASQVISKIIQGFGYTNLFPRECYEFYARITGRTLRVDEDWQFSFAYPSNAFSSKPTSDAFSSMMSSITAAMAARSYSLETLGQHPTQSLTPPLLRPPGIQRGGSLKIPTPTSTLVSSTPTTVSSTPSTSRQQQYTTTSFGVSASTSAITQNRPAHRLASSQLGDNPLKQPRIPLAERPTTSSGQLPPQRRPPPLAATRLRSGHADLVYATRVLVADQPPKESPPPLPVHRSLAARLTDPEMHASNRTFSQPSICFGQQSSAAEHVDDEDQPGPSGFQPKEQRRRSEESEDKDVYSEELPGPSRVLHPQRDRAASTSGTAEQLHHTGYWRHRDPFSDLMEQRQLSTSMGEVLLHSEYERAIGESLSDRPSGQPSPHTQTMSSRCAESLESTRSLTYLEWVHEKQTRRMRTRSEWFLSPVMPQKNNGASKSFDFHSHFHHSSSPMHQLHQLKLPETDTEMSSQSSTEEIRTASYSSSIKEQRPLSPILIFESSLDPMVQKVEEMVVLSGENTPRLPFQMLQHHSGDDDDAPLSATPPARQQPPVFFGEDAPPTKTSKSSKSSSSSSGTQSQKSILIGPSSVAQGQQKSGGLTRVSSIGVVRRKSWRTHYVRPNKSLDQESVPKEELGPTSHSTPAASTRRSSANGDNGKGSSGTTAETSRDALIRRKSSNSAQSSKIPVQARRSTQI